jgi:hypothetical protein
VKRHDIAISAPSTIRIDRAGVQGFGRSEDIASNNDLESGFVLDLETLAKSFVEKSNAKFRGSSSKHREWRISTTSASCLL